MEEGLHVGSVLFPKEPRNFSLMRLVVVAL